MKLGKKQTIIFFLLGLSISIYYYADKLLKKGGGFSEGFLVGFLFALIFVISVTIVFLWGQMIHQNFKVRWKEEK